MGEDWLPLLSRHSMCRRGRSDVWVMMCCVLASESRVETLVVLWLRVQGLNPWPVVCLLCQPVTLACTLCVVQPVQPTSRESVTRRGTASV